MSSLRFVVLTLIATPFISTGAVASDLPLQIGTYRRGVSHSIAIFNKGSRICYQGTSNYGSTIASIKQDSKTQGGYRIYGMSGILIKQNGMNNILFGSDNNLSSMKLDLEYVIESSTLMKKCLGTKKDFYKTEPDKMRYR